MDWTRRHDTSLFRVILVVNPFQANKKTTQRAELWQSIANNLKKSEDPHFKETFKEAEEKQVSSFLERRHGKIKRLNIDNLEESQNIKVCVTCRVFVYVRDCLMFKFATKPPYSTHTITARTGVRVDKNVGCLSS